MADKDVVPDDSLDEGIPTPKDISIAPEKLRAISPHPSLAASEDATVPKRKLFGWLSRNTSGNDVEKAGGILRRGTISSIIFNGSASERPTSGPDNSSTLKDRFKMVRLREEAGINTLGEDDRGDEQGQGPETGHEIELDHAAFGPEEDNAAKSGNIVPAHQQNSSAVSIAAGQPTINVHLPPGTAAGTSTGPNPDAAEPVDWDLWQEVVYEGPAAVARTSADELSKATMRGIPSAIRGVVWQVLAQSKNEELESIYRDLVAQGKTNGRRGSDLRPRPSSLSRALTESELAVPEKEQENAVSSRRSSVQSDAEKTSTGEASRRSSNNISTAVISPDGWSLEALAAEQKEAVMDEKKRMKEDTASLQKLERAIRKDLGARTSYSKFLMSAGLQDGLFGLCKAYALFDEEVGYAQGMNFVAMPLLFNMAEEEAFCLFVRLMNNYKLRDLFIPGMPGLHLHLYQFERLLEDLEPAVYCHLHRRGVQPQLYATQWFLTLFAYRFPLQLVLRIYDLILSEGLESAILKFGIVLMQKNAAQLLQMKDMSALTTFLKERLFDHYIDKSPSASSVLESGFFGSAGGIDKEVYRADELVQDACSVNISAETLKMYTNDWKERVREEKQRQVADEALRISNATLTLRVRQLEERCEKSDAEHIATASELVRTKVENQRMTDEVESLQGRVGELEEIVQKQPEELEAKLRQEMDRVRQRNIEVQNENRALEESQQEMEHELVQAKMKSAEAQAETDAMRQRWANVTNLMSGMVSPPA